MGVQPRHSNDSPARFPRRPAAALALAGLLVSGVLDTGCNDTTAATTSSRHHSKHHHSLSHNQRLGKQLAARRGWKRDQWFCLRKLWTQESGWRTRAANKSGAYGIPQSLPGWKMRRAGADWRSNPRTQIRWGLAYIKVHYGTPCGAWKHEMRRNWY